jgi:hypothetical protein
MMLLLGFSGCSGTPRDPTQFLQPGDGTGQTGNGGGTSALVGSWRATLLVVVPTDTQTWSTTWQFHADGTCRFSREITFFAGGIAQVRERDCTWTTSGATLTAVFLDTGESYPMPWQFQGLASTILVLEGLEYRRVTG